MSDSPLLLEACNTPDNDGPAADFPYGGRILLGDAWYERFLEASDGDEDGATYIALLGMQFTGVLHEQLGYVELAVRNAIDRQLRALALEEQGSEYWTEPGHAPELVNALVADQIRQARGRAQRQANLRSMRQSHRSDASVTHDDVISQLMWGTWTKLVGKGRSDSYTQAQQELWASCLSAAFPNGYEGEEGRKRLSHSLLYIKDARNAEAHFDTLLYEARHVNKLIGTCMSVLSSIDCRLGKDWLNTAELRRCARALREHF